MSKILDVQLEGTDFFEASTKVPFHPKLNCIMGGRGTGKTSIMTIIAWVLDSENDKIKNKEAQRLIEANVGDGQVRITLETDAGAYYTATRMLGEKTFWVDSEGKKLVGVPSEFEDGFIEYYPATIMEKIGVSGEERLKLIDSFVGTEISSINHEINIRISQLRQNEAQIKSREASFKKVKEDLLQYTNIDSQIEEIKKQISESGVDQTTNEKFNKLNGRHNIRREDGQKIKNLKEQTSDLYEASGETILELEKIVNDFKFDHEHVADAQRKLQERVEKNVQSLKSSYEKYQNDLKIFIDEIEGTLPLLRDAFKKEEDEFTEARLANTKSRDLFQKLSQLTQSQTDLKLLNEKVGTLNAEIQGLMDERRKITLSAREHREKLFKARQDKIAELNSVFDGKIKILLVRNAIKKSFEDIIKGLVAYKNMRFSRTEASIVDRSNPDEILEFFYENAADKYAEIVGADSGRVQELFEIIRNNGIQYELETCICNDQPNFYLKIDEEDGPSSYRSSEELSMGQRCTAILPIIFAVSKSILMIDQPEDNLDNKYITKTIHDIIRDIKSQRQLIFVTHNPNIPVVSGAENNVFLEYKDKKSSVVRGGDLASVKDDIVELLEGGKKAFSIRKELYGED